MKALIQVLSHSFVMEQLVLDVPLHQVAVPRLTKLGKKPSCGTPKHCGPGSAAAGLTRIITNPEAYQIHILTTHKRATYVEAACTIADMLCNENKNGKHKELKPTEVKKSEERVRAVEKAFDGFLNPFCIDDTRLICLSSGAPAGEKITLLYSMQKS